LRIFAKQFTPEKRLHKSKAAASEI